MNRIAVTALAILFCVITTETILASLVSGKIDLNDSNRIYRLTGEWRFSRIDRPEFSLPETDDSQWEWLRVPGEWITMGMSDVGVGWYRCHFTLAPTFQMVPIAIQVPVIVDAHELYVNGIKVGGSGIISAEGIVLKKKNPPAVYTIPKEILKDQGVNVIALRVGDDVGWGGIATNQLYLGPAKLLELNFKKTVLWNTSVVLVLGFLGIFFMILFLYFGRERSFLYFSLLALVIGLTLFGYFSYPFWLLDNYWFYFLIFHSGINLAPILAIRFIYAFLDMPNNKLTKWLTIECSILITVLLLTPFHNRILRLYAYVTLNIALVTLLFCVIYLMIKVGISIKQNKVGARIAGVGNFVVLICFLNDILGYLLAIDTTRLGLEGMVAFMICNSYALFIKHSQVT